jgi:hypothetical protein
MRILKLLFTIMVFSYNFTHLFNANAATILANSCSQQDVQAAIDSAIDGDVVQIPDGSCTWTTSGAWGEAAVYITDKAVTLRGNGVYEVDSAHHDTGNWPLTITLNIQDGSGIEISGSSGQKIRVTGIYFTGSVAGGTSGFGAVGISSSNKASDVRVDNCKFSVSGCSVASETSGLGGLVDHIYVHTGCDTGGMVTAEDTRNDGLGNWAFTQPVGFGSKNFLFIEDSTFWKECTGPSGSAPNVVDAQAGGKFVFRYNYVKNGFISPHGAESGAPERSGYAFEVYENELYWDLPGDKFHAAVFQRGGTMLVYNNIATNYQALWKTWVHRATTPWGIFGQCDGTQDHDGNYGYYQGNPVAVRNGTESGDPEKGGYTLKVYENELYWDLPGDKFHAAVFQRGGTVLVYNNIATNYQALWKKWVHRATTPWGIFDRWIDTQAHGGNYRISSCSSSRDSYPPGYPCLDQVGRGQTSGIPLSDIQPQQESKCYIWNNKRNNTGAVYHNNPSYVVEGRDYEISDDDSARPSWYTPFPYPHPLTQ